MPVPFPRIVGNIAGNVSGGCVLYPMKNQEDGGRELWR